MSEQPYHFQINFSETSLNPQKPWDDDKLGRRGFANHLTQIITGQVNPCVITINGEWGCGKTFLLKRWQLTLLANGYDSLYFNAWNADLLERASLALIGELYSHLKSLNDEKLSENISNLQDSFTQLLKFSNLSRVLAHKVEEATGIDIVSAKSHCLDDYNNAIGQKNALRAAIQDISTLTHEKTGKPFVFIVDELDRCRPLFAIEILETIKHIFDVPHCIFVLGIDRGQLQKSIQAVYGEIDSQKYLERFFDFEMRLASPNVATYFDHIYDSYIPTNQNLPGYMTAGSKDGRSRTTLMHICEYFNLNLREIEIVFKTFFAVLIFDEIQKCRHPILLAIMIVVRLKKPEKYVEFVNSECNPRDVIDLPFDNNGYLPECFGMVMASIYNTYSGSLDRSKYEEVIDKLYHSKLWDVSNPQNDNDVPDYIIPRYITEALEYRRKVLSTNQRAQHDFNPSLYFIKPISDYQVPTKRDKLEFAKYLDMIA